MARPKKNREVSIVHFSFFDLLFGAFGAFVFLMIMQVLATLNMVDMDTQTLIDQMAQDKQALKQELVKFRETDQKLEAIQQQLNQALEERSKLIQEQKQLSDKNEELSANLNSLQDEMSALETVRAEVKQKEALQKDLQNKIEQLNQDKAGLDQKNNELETRMASLKEEIESLRQFKEKVVKKSDLQKALEEENKGLKETRAQLAQDKVRLESELEVVREKLASLNKFKSKVEKKGDVVKALEEENKKLEKSLDQTRQKLAALKTSPLKIKTTSLPTIITGERIQIASAAEGGSPPYTWKLSGKLPQGLSMNQITGNITGIAKRDGKYSFSLKVQDARGMVAESKKAITVNVIKKYKEQEKKVSPMFVVMALISSLLLLYILWGKYKAAKRWKEIVKQAKARGEKEIRLRYEI